MNRLGRLLSLPASWSARSWPSIAWPVVDLRVDWAEHDPIGQLERLWLAYKPQMQDYVTRALDPTRAPSYGVPGDE